MAAGGSCQVFWLCNGGRGDHVKSFDFVMVAGVITSQSIRMPLPFILHKANWNLEWCGLYLVYECTFSEGRVRDSVQHW